MSWTNPSTWAAGDIPDHTQLNTYVRDNLRVLGGVDLPRAKLKHASNQAITYAVQSTLLWSTHTQNVGSIHSSKKIKGTKGGIWLVGFWGAFAAAAFNSRRFMLAYTDTGTNNHTVAQGRQTAASTSNGVFTSIGGLSTVETPSTGGGSAWQVRCYQDSAPGTLNATTTRTFWAVWQGGA